MDEVPIADRLIRVPLLTLTIALIRAPSSSTRAYITKCAKRWGNVESIEVVAQMRFDLPKMYKFHKKKSRDVEVDMIRLTRR